MGIAESGGSLDAGNRGGAYAVGSLAAQVTLIVIRYPLHCTEIINTSSTRGTNPILGQIFKGRTRFYSIVRVALCRIIHIATNITYIFFHFSDLLD